MVGGLNMGIAFAAGVLSFLSPCVLPLIPAYLSLMGGTSLQNLKDSGALRRNAFFNTAFFVLGFSIIFMILGMLFTTTFALLSGLSQAINLVAGVVVIVLGLNFIFDFWKTLNFEKRFHLSRKPTSKPTSLLFGMAFGAGWSPCIGPILSSILFLAGSSGELVRGMWLLLVYSLGLGLPFLLTALFLPSALRRLERVKKHLRTIKIGGGIFLIFVGTLILLGRFQQFNVVLFGLAYRIEQWELAHPQTARFLFSGVFLVLAGFVAGFYIRRIRGDRHRTEGSENAVADEEPRAASVRLIRPVRLIAFAALVTASVLAITGVLNFSEILATWFSYQGI